MRLRGEHTKLYDEGNNELGTWQVPPQSQSYGCSVDLTGKTSVYAKQELCAKWSDQSNVVAVLPSVGYVSAPIILGPVYECAGAVQVSMEVGKPENVAMLFTVMSEALGPISTPQLGLTVAMVPVTPTLVLSDKIYALVELCGTTYQSPHVQVQPFPVDQFGPPIVEAFELDSWVYVGTQSSQPSLGAVIPGAWVDIFIQSQGVPNRWRGGGFITGAFSGNVLISGTVQVGDIVSARQQMCGRSTDFGLPWTVVAPPIADFTLSPASGVAPLTIECTNQSTGQITNYFWRFHWGEMGGQTSVAIPNPSYTYVNPGTFIVHLAVSGPGGGSEHSEQVTVTKKPPKPPQPQSAQPGGWSRVVIYNCNVNTDDNGFNLPVYIWVWDSNIADWVSEGDLLVAQYDSSGNCPATGTPWSLQLQDGHIYDIIVVDPALPACDDGQPDNQACVRKSWLGILGSKNGPVYIDPATGNLPTVI